MRYYSVLSCVADVSDCLLQRLSAIVIKNIIIIIIIIITVGLEVFGGRPCIGGSPETRAPP